MARKRVLQDSTVYAFHVPALNAIKVGFGADGRARMRDYSKRYDFKAVAVSLREWSLPASSLAAVVEAACHQALREASLTQVSRVVDDQEAQELFDLGPHSYEQAVLVVAAAIEETVDSLHAALGKLKPRAGEEARQRKEAAQRARTEAARVKLEAEQREFERAKGVLQARWDTEMKPYVDWCDYAQTIYKQFSHQQGFLDAALRGKRSFATRMLAWESWPKLRDSTPHIFRASRRARAFRVEFRREFPKFPEPDYEKKHPSLNSPEGHYLPHCERDDPTLEVRLAVQQATGSGGDDALELINRCQELHRLVEEAERHPVPY